MENKEIVKNDIASDIEKRFKELTESEEDKKNQLYGEGDDEYEEDQKALDRIAETYKTFNKRLAKTEYNRWGYSPAGYLSKKLVSKHLNSMKHGLFSIFPIPCKQEGCPYGASCIALQNKLEPPLGEPCILEVNKIENLLVRYANDFDLESSSTTDQIFIQELVQLDLMMDRCQNLMAQEASPLQEVTMGVTDDGEIYTQPVVSRYYDAWERMSKRRQSLLNEMMATRHSRKGLKEDTLNEADIILKSVDQNGDDFFSVEERPEKFKEENK